MPNPLGLLDRLPKEVAAGVVMGIQITLLQPDFAKAIIEADAQVGLEQIGADEVANVERETAINIQKLVDQYWS